MNKQKIIKYILIAIPLLFLAKWGIETVIYDSNKIPDINPHPTRKVRIHGQFPFANDVDLKITVIYINKNPKCDHKLWIAGTQFPLKKEKTFQANIKNGFFESNINLDDYLSGSCEWEPHHLYASMKSKNNITIKGDIRSGGTLIRPAMTYIAAITNNNILNNDTSEILCSYGKQTFSKGYPDEITKTFLECKSENFLDYNISHLQKEINVDFVHKQ